MKNPPILVSVLGFFAALAGFAWLFLGLRMLGFDWFGVLGDLPAFESVGIWGWFTIIGGLLWLSAAFGLWTLQPWGWLLAMVVAGVALFQAVLAMFQFPGTGVGFSMAILPLLIVLYLNSRDIKSQFGIGDEPAS
jgi:hypothetical protein